MLFCIGCYGINVALLIKLVKSFISLLGNIVSEISKGKTTDG